MKSQRKTNDDRARRRSRTARHEGRAATLRIRVKNALSELGRVSRLVERFGAAHGLTARVVFETTLALDEVLTNVISYGYDDSDTHDIRIGLSCADGQLVIAVEDDGRPFNPLHAPAPALDGPLETRPVGGVGIHLVRQVMDHLEYTRRAGRNSLVMTKRTGAREPGHRGGT
jgi:serine/threonine-protein kinase RsbW